MQGNDSSLPSGTINSATPSNSTVPTGSDTAAAGLQNTVPSLTAAGKAIEEPKQVCAFFLRTASCAYGSRCRFLHPTNVPPPVLNSKGYPLRPQEHSCAHYLKKGWCAFGMTCKFHHPELIMPTGLAPGLTIAQPGGGNVILTSGPGGVQTLQPGTQLVYTTQQPAGAGMIQTAAPPGATVYYVPTASGTLVPSIIQQPAGAGQITVVGQGDQLITTAQQMPMYQTGAGGTTMLAQNGGLIQQPQAMMTQGPAGGMRGGYTNVGLQQQLQLQQGGNGGGGLRLNIIGNDANNNTLYTSDGDALHGLAGGNDQLGGSYLQPLQGQQMVLVGNQDGHLMDQQAQFFDQVGRGGLMNSGGAGLPSTAFLSGPKSGGLLGGQGGQGMMNNLGLNNGQSGRRDSGGLFLQVQGGGSGRDSMDRSQQSLVQAMHSLRLNQQGQQGR